MGFLTLILLIFGMIMLCGMINHGFRIATRIAIATERSAVHMAALYYALTPEAKARIDVEIARLKQES